MSCSLPLGSRRTALYWRPVVPGLNDIAAARRLAGHLAPDPATAEADACALCVTGPAQVTDRAVLVQGLSEQPRSFLQHGRADTGWPEEGRAP
ncbi:hypothetical protein [Streptomyces sp. MAR4 CNX-425]|uniref:hypothetical protein n=1 Tax=Streptomyces sp. MAR4 CNX-425 TaxID=3406343 RepID=UPI003B512E9A